MRRRHCVILSNSRSQCELTDAPRSPQAPANNPSAFAMPTPSPSQIEKTALDHVWFHVSTRESLTSPSGMMVFESGEGCYLTDIHGRTYLDGLSGGAFVTNIGHGRKEVADAYAEQASRL